MPFIRGSYHINPVMGEALEAAREAEAALHALEAEHGSHGAPHDQADGFASPHASDPVGAGHGPVHRVEIEAAEMVPSHSGRAARGFVARVHRFPAANAHGEGAGAASHSAARPGLPSHAETHVFSDHHDLVNFLHNELGKR